MFRRTLAGATAAGALLLLASCDQREPAGPSDTAPGPDLAPTQGSADDPASLARGVPGFGGFFIDAQGHARHADERANRALADVRSD